MRQAVGEKLIAQMGVMVLSRLIDNSFHDEVVFPNGLLFPEIKDPVKFQVRENFGKPVVGCQVNPVLLSKILDRVTERRFSTDLIAHTPAAQ